MIARFAGVLLSVCSLFGCKPGLSHDEQIVGPYRLIATDVSEKMHVAYSGAKGSVVCIPQTVFAIGWDDRYIVAKQHPRDDRGITNFYFLDISRGSATNDPVASVIGPLTEDEFEYHREELGLPEFKRTIKSLE